nr:rhamnan synthesis F family protein [Polynucleobacter sp. TUM22923]
MGGRSVSNIRKISMDQVDPIAIVIHVFYEDVFEEILGCLDRINLVKHKLYVTCPQDNEERIQKRLAAAGHDYFLLPVENRGRDILPFLSVIPIIIADGYAILIKVHTKKSPHREDGQAWLRGLLDALLTDQSISRALNYLKKNPKLGILVPEDCIVPIQHYFEANSARTLHFAEKLKVDNTTLNQLTYAAGTMFFARSSALIPLLDFNLTNDDFEPEAGQLDGTMAHAIERVISLSVQASQHSFGGIKKNGDFFIPEPLSYEDWQIKELKKEVAECWAKIKYLRETVSGREGQIASLNQAICERSSPIEEIFSSTSWRITSPLRKVGAWGRRVIRIWKLFQSYRQRHSGAAGIHRLAVRVYETLAKGGLGGLGGLRKTIGLHEARRLNSSTLTPLHHPHYILPLEEIDSANALTIQDVAVHAHIYYSELAPEIRHYLENIPVPFNLYVTTDTADKAASIKTTLAGMLNVLALDIRVVPNRGRDIGPMLVELGETLTRHEIVLHIHTKRSPHNPNLRGWRRYLMQSLLGNPRLVAAILDRFAREKQLGILYPQTYHPVIPFMRIGGNAAAMSTLLRRAGRDDAEIENIDTTDFPAGFMLWFRGNAIEPFIRMKFGIEEFDFEAGQDDSTLAHAIERILPYFASIGGFSHQSFLPVRMLSPTHPGAVPLSELLSVLPSSLIAIRIIFDHNIGGGANRYSRDLINAIIAEGSTVLRIYYANHAWFVEWIAADDGMIFVEASTDALFEALAGVGAEVIIVNSPYMYPEIDRVIENIVSLARATGMSVDYKVHDFYVICPSQHLLENNDQYCSVPQDVNVCNSCLVKNKYVHWGANQPVDIVKWRQPFVDLFEIASTITIFDPSSVEIMRRVFNFDDAKIRVVPHEHLSFKHVQTVGLGGPLHIGMFGTLTEAKGSVVINKLAEFIASHNLNVPITLVGSSHVLTEPSLRVLGTYKHEELPHIVQREGINVFLMASIIPETFSYTISEAMQMELPIVAFDIGAQGNRVKQYKFGKVVPLDSSLEVILEAIQSVLKIAQGLKR